MASLVQNYTDHDEYKRRYAIFRENMKKIQFLRETERGTARLSELTVLMNAGGGY